MTADLPPTDTLPKTTMTSLKRYYLSLTVVQHTDADGRTYYEATEHGVEIEGHGRTAPQAIADYAARVGDFQPPQRDPKRTNAEVVDPAEVDGDE